MIRMQSTSVPDRMAGDESRPPPVTHAPPGHRRPTRHARGARARVALILVLALSLLPMPLLSNVTIAQSSREHRPPPPPAEAVRLLERLRDGGASLQQRARQAKPKKQRANAKPQKAKRAQARRGPRVRLINRKGCVFRVRGKTWILVRTCTPRGTLVIPNGITLNGHNRAMIVTGNLAKFDGVVVATGFGRANLRNLRIEGRAVLTAHCPDVFLDQFFFGVLVFQSSGTIANVTVRNIDPPGGCDAVGIGAFGRKKVNVLSSTIHNAGSFGLVLQQTVNGTVAGNTILIASGSPNFAGFGEGIDLDLTTNMVVRGNDLRRGGPGDTTGIFSSGPVGLTVAGNRFQNLDNGVEVFGFSEVVPGSAVIRDNQMSGVTVDGIDTESAVLLILRNTISAATGSDQGIELGDNTSGAVNSNTVANFVCGIELDPDSTVVLGQGAQANTFVNNGQDVCP